MQGVACLQHERVGPAYQAVQPSWLVHCMAVGMVDPAGASWRLQLRFMLRGRTREARKLPVSGANVLGDPERLQYSLVCTTERYL